MMDWIIRSGIRFRLLVLVGAAAMMFLGVTQLRAVTVDALPEFSPTYVEVQTEALGLSAAEVEQLITVPLEADLLNGVAWLKHIRSESVPGLSSLVLVFEPGTDPLKARQVVNERITQAKALPNVSKPPTMLEPLSSASRVLMIGLTPRNPKDLSLIDASVLAQWTIKPRLMAVRGVANVSLWGQRDQQLQVQVDPKRLAAQDVSLAQVLQTAGNAMWVSPLSFLEASTPGTGGFIDTSNQRLGIQHISPIVSAGDLAQVTVEDTPGRVVRLGDVTTVVSDHQPLIGDAATGSTPSLLLMVEKFPGASPLEVTRGLETAIDELRPGLSGLQIDTSVFRPATFIEMAMRNVGTWLLIGAVALVVVLGLVLFHWRTAVISLAAIVVSLMAAALVLQLTGATANMMILAGLVAAIGLVVDDAIVDLERIRHRLAQDRDSAERSTAGHSTAGRSTEGPPTAGRSTIALVAAAALQARGAIIYATSITALAVLPVFFLGGPARDFYQPLALAYLVTVAASMVIALIVTPALCVLVLSRGGLSRRESAVLHWGRHRLDQTLRGVLQRPRRVLAAGAVLLVIGVGVLPLFEQSLLPSVKDPYLLIQFDGPPGTSLPEMNRITTRASGELRTIPGVRTVASQVGRAVLADQVVGINSGQLWIGLDPAADYDRAVADIGKTVRGYPGVTSDVATYEKRRTSEILSLTPDSDATDDMTVRVYGQDSDVLRAKAQEVLTMLAGVDGVMHPHMELQVQQPTMVLEVNLAAAQRFGLKPGDIRRAAATLLAGTEVGSLYEGQKIFQVVVWGTPDARHSLSSLRDLVIDTPNGGHVRLGDVAEVGIASKPTVVKREDVSRRIDVSANVSGRTVSSVQRDVSQRLKNIAFPTEYHAALLGDYAERQASVLRVLAVSIAVAIGILLLLQAAFGSWRLAAAVFVALPVALTGGILAALTSGRLITLGSLLGLLAVLGIAARHCVLLIRHYQELRAPGPAARSSCGRSSAGPCCLVLRGTRDRLGPILSTTLAIAALFVPVLILGNVAGLEIVQPMAVVVLGGLVTSAFLNLVVVPALYLSVWPRSPHHLSIDQREETGWSTALDGSQHVH
ncbi:MAG: efflux RND transporter permease subunit [Pseudonocardiales bacterium]|nr:efflux RND transporter permease subunit [Pseudonocardiales bacterium]